MHVRILMLYIINNIMYTFQMYIIQQLESY